MPSSLNSIQETLRSLDHYVTADYLANLLKLNPRTIYLWARTGRMPSVRLHGVVRFDPVEAADWLESTTLFSLPPKKPAGSVHSAQQKTKQPLKAAPRLSEGDQMTPRGAVIW